MLGFFPDLLFFGIVAVALAAMLAAIALVVKLVRDQRRAARQAGYPSLAAYLRAAPRTDEERRDAADLALKGAAICLLAFIFPPLLLIGLFPLFYGARKVVWVWMGLGLVDDPEPPHPRA